ncbi:matrix metalloproteinase-19-like isoform X1 [Cryptotermes secundus]|uniref:matrix metalloproteinase-19-like isoform X1 n=1 Tax=Cryptotermes secundus TaxID=105785 RepID=UPI001454BD33|nr:matrix metalloproteinase-19-like isoform X1 [Cryptotermes secundus]XP_033607727.1 matrix metalloproteinase-19-like isoform X1 [Cryptotermes secundus]XP_033607728.1 matrix metalloproteinase-19-like isoform X1 [Cryptotermes secundus]XP_033607729.1 matrix metalloproteinase-19-like isoform X1 [Cryptotermes secundus]XP_033607730.1 matrix metalloproteinase-19-like isoform X1 [Cryptotermes secundus]XP_033607731.1 matrix metalloproteinase-19-like isoform X1 [Cryptotermes secundus]XP_033607732.1 ma
MILGHASKPMEGMVHFDDDEPWSSRRFSGQNLFLVAVHELGHALGLHHSDVKGSIMQPVLTRGYEPGFMLHNDDITGLQLLYGKRKHHPPDLCSESLFDAIFENPDGIIYVLKGQYYWKLSQDGFVNSYPLLASHHWQGLPGDVDAACATSSGRTYFFKGSKYWAYRYTHPLAGHPKLISEGWPGIPDDVDAATWYTDSVFLFFNGDQYWVYDSHQKPSVSRTFPQPMTAWGNIAGDLHDIMYIRSGYIYFFTEGSSYRYNCKTKLVDPAGPGQPNYPRAVGPWWFQCNSKEVQP